MRVKQVKVKCGQCGQRFTYVRAGAGRPPVYCSLCAADRRREQTLRAVHAFRYERGGKAVHSFRGDAAQAAAEFLANGADGSGAR